MTVKLWFLIPEFILFGAAVVVSVMGLSRSRVLRDASPFIAIAALLAGAVATPIVYADEERLANAGLLLPFVGQYVKIVVCAVGALIALLSIGMVDRGLEAAFESGRAPFDPIRVTRGEYWSFFLLSLIGIMLISTANDLIWLFLALELTSLPTYVMVATARSRRASSEAAIKYFFLGAMAAAMFLFGFAFVYGATGTIILTEIRNVFAFQLAFHEDGISALGTIGMILALLGVCFKIAAAPMHFYAADVYQGAPGPVTAFLAFAPKSAGIITFILLLSTIVTSAGAGDALAYPSTITAALFMISVLTMTLGNVLAMLQRSIKRILAYSSIAHSGYMLIGVIAGPGAGFDAALFYILAYGVMNTAAFAVLAALERQGEEIDSLDDLAGLGRRHPGMAAVMALASLSLLGFPPLLGFVGKFYLFAAGIEAGQVALVVIACLNSAISAWYYLKLAGLPILAPPSAASEGITRVPSYWPRFAALLAAAAVATLWVVAQPISDLAGRTMDGEILSDSPDSGGAHATAE
jgi:NADH-quinone oxidoreductase subunit N